MKKPKPKKNRNVYAASLRDPKFRPQKTRNKKAYTRKGSNRKR